MPHGQGQWEGWLQQETDAWNANMRAYNELEQSMKAGRAAVRPQTQDITLGQIQQNARELLPKVLVDWIENTAIPGAARATEGLVNAAKNFVYDTTGIQGPPVAAAMQGPPEPTGNTKEDEAALDAHLQALSAMASSATAAAMQQLADGAQATQATVDAQRVQQPGQTPLSSTYTELMGGDRTVVGRFSPGSQMLSRSPNVQIHQDPVTGEMVATVPSNRQLSRAQYNQDDTKVMAQNVQTSQAPPTAQPQPFNIEKELSKMDGLRGDEALAFARQLKLNLELELAKTWQNIQNQAAVKSGLRAAEVALQTNLEADISTGHLQRWGVASAQTIKAQEVLHAAQINSKVLEDTLAKTNPQLKQLESAKAHITNVEQRRALSQLQAEERAAGVATTREERQREIASTISPNQLANYRIAYGSEGDDTKDRYAIAKRIDHDPVMKALVSLDSTNVYSLLTDPRREVRMKAGEILNQQDRAANNLPPAQNSPIYNKIRPFLDKPERLIEAMPKEARARFEAEVKLLAPKEAAVRTANQSAALLEAYVQKEIKATYNDMRNWKSDVLTPGSPLTEAIQNVSKANPTGAAPLDLVIAEFLNKQVLGADGKPIEYKNKVALLQQALTGTVNNEAKSLAFTDPASVHRELAAHINTQSLRYTVGGKFSEFFNNLYKEAPLVKPIVGAYERGPGPMIFGGDQSKVLSPIKSGVEKAKAWWESGAR